MPRGQEFQNDEDFGVEKKVDLGVSGDLHELPTGRSLRRHSSACVQDFQTQLEAQLSMSWSSGSSVGARDFLFVGSLELKAMPFLPAAWASSLHSALACGGEPPGPMVFLHSMFCSLLSVCHSPAQCSEYVLALEEPLCYAHLYRSPGARPWALPPAFLCLASLTALG